MEKDLRIKTLFYRGERYCAEERLHNNPEFCGSVETNKILGAKAFKIQNHKSSSDSFDCQKFVTQKSWKSLIC